MSVPPLRMDFEIKKRSSLDAMCLSLVHFLFQVYNLSALLIDIRDRSLDRVSKAVLAAFREHIPPFFSLRLRMRLKSPPRIQLFFPTDLLRIYRE